MTHVRYITVICHTFAYRLVLGGLLRLGHGRQQRRGVSRLLRTTATAPVRLRAHSTRYSPIRSLPLTPRGL